MSCTVQFAPEAQAQLDAIEEYIAVASGFPATAAHFVDSIIAYCESFRDLSPAGCAAR